MAGFSALRALLATVAVSCVLYLSVAAAERSRPAFQRSRFASAEAAAAALSGSKPNIVMLFVDDLGYGDLGLTGHPTTQTPNIDKLGWGGMRLSTWYSGAALCSASRASIMTGRQWPRVGSMPVFGPTGNVGIWTNETTMAQGLKQAGYTTAICGKWHLGQMPEFLPGARGFDEYLGIPYSDDMGEARATPCNGQSGPEARVPSAERPTVFADGSVKTAYGYKYGEEIVGVTGSDPAGEYLPLVYQRGDGSNATTQVLEQPLDFTTLAQQYANFSAQFIRANKDKPFFLYHPFSHVHTTASNQPEKQYANCAHQNKTVRGKFGDALLEVDWLVGNIVQELKDAKVEDNTLILLTGDNGPWLAQGSSGGSRGLFYGVSAGYDNTGKGATWEGGIREAGLAYWPGVIDPMSHSTEIVSSMDVLVTAFNLSGVPLPSDRPYDGRNMLPVLMGGKSEHDVLFFYKKNGGPPDAARYGNYKAYWVTGPGIGACKAGFNPCKEVDYTKTAAPLMFNVNEDPSEAYPLNAKGVMPSDPTLLAVVKTFQAAYKNEVATFIARNPMTGTGGTPGQYGVCCDRSQKCDCDGPPSQE